MYGLSYDMDNVIITSDNLVLKLADYNKAVQRLQEALLNNPEENDLFLDGTIQRFEFSYELAWKLVKAYLVFEGIEANSPRACIREGFRVGLISKAEEWMDMLDKRNLTSHTYNVMTAKEIYSAIQDRYVDLLSELAVVMADKIG